MLVLVLVVVVVAARPAGVPAPAVQAQGRTRATGPATNAAGGPKRVGTLATVAEEVPRVDVGRPLHLVAVRGNARRTMEAAGPQFVLVLGQVLELVRVLVLGTETLLVGDRVHHLDPRRMGVARGRGVRAMGVGPQGRVMATVHGRWTAMDVQGGAGRMNQRDRPGAGHVTTAHGPMNDREVTTVRGAHRVLIASPAVGPIPGPADHGAGQPLQQGVIGPVSKAETIALHPRLGRGVRIARLVVVGRRVMIGRVMIGRVMIGHSAKERRRVVMGRRVVVGMRRGDRLPGKVPTVDR